MTCKEREALPESQPEARAPAEYFRLFHRPVRITLAVQVSTSRQRRTGQVGAIVGRAGWCAHFLGCSARSRRIKAPAMPEGHTLEAAALICRQRRSACCNDRK